MSFRSPIPKPRLPAAPRSIEKGASLGNVLGEEAVDCLAHNIGLVYSKFDQRAFLKAACNGLQPLGLMDRGPHIAAALREFLPMRFDKAVAVLLKSLTPPLQRTDGNGLAVFFYHPHACFVANYGLDAAHNGGNDPFDVAMQAHYELTQRFTAEFSLRPFLIQQQDRTLSKLSEWVSDASPHVRRLCSEGTRPRLPWGQRLRAFIENPSPALPILEALKDDPSLYVRRSVANHLGDIAKDHVELAIQLCERWLRDASPERKWLIRHALRYPAKQGDKAAIRLRTAAR